MISYQWAKVLTQRGVGTFTSGLPAARSSLGGEQYCDNGLELPLASITWAVPHCVRAHFDGARLAAGRLAPRRSASKVPSIIKLDPFPYRRKAPRSVLAKPQALFGGDPGLSPRPRRLSKRSKDRPTQAPTKPQLPYRRQASGSASERPHQAPTSLPTRSVREQRDPGLGPPVGVGPSPARISQRETRK